MLFAALHESAFGPKQTWPRAVHMSAFGGVVEKWRVMPVK
jgi:hypothetical protein